MIAVSHLHDEYGNRIVHCYICNEYNKTDYFVMYGGKGTENEGVCRKCAIMKGWIKK